MEDFPLLLLFFIFYLIAGSSKKKKNQKRSRGSARPGSMRTRAQGERADMRAAARDNQTLEGFKNAFGKIDKDTDCENRLIHLHEVSQAQLKDAGEGEDPCHAGGEPVLENAEAGDVLGEADDSQRALREDVLRGVIMSEILTRPCDRMAMRRSGQRRHGY